MVIQGISNITKGSPKNQKQQQKIMNAVGTHSVAGSGGTSGMNLVIGVGTQVNIKRTDGRVHTALVSSVNWETRSVTVEWFEKHETKGKEMDLDTIVTLNPHVLPTMQPKPSVQNVLPAPSASSTMNNTTSNTARSNTTDSQIGNMSSKVQQNLGLKPPGRIPQRQANNRQTVIAPSALPVPVLNNMKDDEDMDTGGGGTVGRETMAVNGNNSKQQQDQARRRSNVVKEVEKLKKDREARRQKHAEIKTEKENLMEPGNPHWEFSTMIKEYRQGLELAPLKENDIVEDHQITVCVRKRPMNKKELNRKEVDVITVPNKNQISVHEPKQKVDLTKYLENQHFRFDYAFDESCTNETVYKYTARPLVQTIFDGGMATCFAYGQTGSGKTHTMGGTFNGKTQDCISGIYAMTARDVFQMIRRFAHLTVGCSFFEIYSGKVFDLLAQKARLRVLEDGKQQVQVVGLTERDVTGVDDVLKLIAIGNSARTSGQTSANSNSSRSHAVFQIILRNTSGPKSKCHGKFSLIDLAGNERGADTSSADRQTRMEGAEINKSLLALKECIRALGRKGAHLPFRASKLTQVLRDSFIGEKSKTCMIAMISPGLSSCEHSLNTLRYADRVKELAATDPMEIRAIDEEMEDETEFQQLASLNENDMSSEMLTFHEVMSKLQEAEDEMVEQHKCLVDTNAQWAMKDIQLLNLTNQVEWDQELYAGQLDALLDEKIDMINEMKVKIQKFRALAREEEFASKQVSSHNFRK